MIIIETILLALVISLLTGGSLSNLKHEQLRGEWVLVCLLPLQAAWPGLSRSMGLGRQTSVALWLVMMAGLLAVLGMNVRSRPVLGIAAVGIALNALVIALNGAMPVSLQATSEIGTPRSETLVELEQDYLHEPIREDTRLSVLCDVIAVPGPEWQRGVISLGDVLLTVGLAGWIFVSTKGKQG